MRPHTWKFRGLLALLVIFVAGVSLASWGYISGSRSELVTPRVPPVAERHAHYRPPTEWPITDRLDGQPVYTAGCFHVLVARDVLATPAVDARAALSRVMFLIGVVDARRLRREDGKRDAWALDLGTGHGAAVHRYRQRFEVLIAVMEPTRRCRYADYPPVLARVAKLLAAFR